MKSRHAMRAVMSVSVLAFGQAPGGPPDPAKPAARAPEGPEGSPGVGWGGGWCHILTPPGQPEGAYATNTWPGGIVPYRFYTLNPPNPPYVSPENQQRAVDAMATIEAVCNVDFIPWTTQTNYVYIFAHATANNSFVGLVGGGQTINIAAWTSHYIIVHELGHALGLWHEQQRPDRDLYVTINFGNIQGGLGGFTIPGGTTAFGWYDFSSVMHYNRYSWTRNGSETISVLPAYAEWKYLCGGAGGGADRLSTGDIWVFTHLYGGNRPPGVFELVAPAHRAPVGTAWMPVFEWTASELTDSYQLVADDDPSFASPEIDVTVPGTSYTAPSLLPRQEVFYWKVRAANATGQTLAWPRPVRCFYTESTAPGTLYVDDSAPPGGNGASWPTAMKDLQDALALADCSGGSVTEIRVGQGVYTPDRATGDRDASFPLVGGVTVLGGYAGINAPNPNARDPALYVTTLTGDLAGNDQPGFVNYEENSRHVVFGQGVQGVCILDGLTITGGNADGPGFLTDEGGGVEAIGSAVEIRDCRVLACSANFAGAGLRGRDAASIHAMDTLVEGNRVPATGTGAAGLGGTLGSTATLERCTIRANTGNVGAGMSIAFGSTGTVRDCLFEDNVAGQLGGALRTFLNATTTIDRCVFRNNTANLTSPQSGYGGAIANYGSPEGGVLSTMTVSNCLFVGNTAAVGGGALHNDQSGIANIRNSTIVGNTGAVGQGGGIRNSNTFGGTNSLSAANCIVRGNTGGQIVTIGATTLVTYSDVEGGHAGIGNITADPLFLNAASGNYRLGGLSPCVDAGSNLTVPVGVVLDLDANPRFVDDPCAPNTGVGGGAGGTAIADMGAYERKRCYPDCNADCALTVADFGCFQTKFVAGDPYADCNGDGSLTVADFGCFQTKFVAACP